MIWWIYTSGGLDRKQTSGTLLWNLMLDISVEMNAKYQIHIQNVDFFELYHNVSCTSEANPKPVCDIRINDKKVHVVKFI